VAKTLLIVFHAPSPNTVALRDAVVNGAEDPEVSGVVVRSLAPLNTVPEDVIMADAVILGTTENLGYMSGALKDFFDRCYYPCLDVKQGLPYALIVRAGHDGTGTRRAVESITTGLRWRAVQEPLILRGAYDPSFNQRCEELGRAMSNGLEAGVF